MPHTSYLVPIGYLLAPVPYWTDRANLDHALDASWMAHPLVRAAINEQVSGRAEVWPTQRLREQLADRIPLRKTLSIGCGIGNLERDLVGQGIVARITGIDFPGEVLEQAKTLAAGDPRIDYVGGDAFEYLRTHGELDAIFFHQSLHHFERIPELMRLVREALVPGGLFWIDEFVGPSMHEWNALRLLIPNVAYYLLPRSVRRVKIVRTPRNPGDPTEAVCAAEILPAIERELEIVERRDYGGNLVALLYPNLQRASSDLERALRFLLRLEGKLLRAGARSFHSVVLARRPS